MKFKHTFRCLKESGWDIEFIDQDGEFNTADKLFNYMIYKRMKSESYRIEIDNLVLYDLVLYDIEKRIKVDIINSYEDLSYILECNTRGECR